MASAPYSFNASTLELIIEGYTAEYARHRGHDKVASVFHKVSNSNSLAKLIGKSVQYQISPTAKDFCLTVSGITSFLFSEQQTIALAALFAIRIWEQKVNRQYGFCNSTQLRDMGIEIFNILKL